MKSNTGNFNTLIKKMVPRSELEQVRSEPRDTKDPQSGTLGTLELALAKSIRKDLSPGHITALAEMEHIKDSPIVAEFVTGPTAKKRRDAL
jgi:hypothetical protein